MKFEAGDVATEEQRDAGGTVDQHCRYGGLDVAQFGFPGFGLGLVHELADVGDGTDGDDAEYGNDDP